ncbi:MAG TPA: ABC transporter ATP-binding protein [Actinomycetota bacterium]|nr:ABC transporter ATP-binding protein [Actinomycetota bacterium]
MEAIGVCKVYQVGVPVTALTDAHVSVRPGEMVAVQGPSGSGKSTLLGLLGLLDTPTAGVVRIKGDDISGLRDAARSRLRASTFGFVFQQFNLIPHLTAVENVAAALLYRQVSSKIRAARARDVLERVGLGDRSEHKPGEMSGGEQQRVALARAVVANPQVILADEPTGNLDTDATAAVLELLMGFVAQRVAVLVATHDPEVASRADRSLRMRDGRIVR